MDNFILRKLVTDLNTTQQFIATHDTELSITKYHVAKLFVLTDKILSCLCDKEVSVGKLY